MPPKFAPHHPLTEAHVTSAHALLHRTMTAASLHDDGMWGAMLSHCSRPEHKRHSKEKPTGRAASLSATAKPRHSPANHHRLPMNRVNDELVSQLFNAGCPSSFTHPNCRRWA